LTQHYTAHDILSQTTTCQRTKRLVVLYRIPLVRLAVGLLYNMPLQQVVGEIHIKSKLIEEEEGEEEENLFAE